VAFRVALRVRAKAAKQGRREPLADAPPASAAADDLVWRDLRPVLDEELARLPAKYRAPLVLCYLGGQTNEEAAEQLGCPKGTIVSRLARGRERLRARLARRGLALSAAYLATALSRDAAAAVPAALVSSTAKIAAAVATGQAAAGLVSAPVAALSKGVLQAMFLTKLKIAAAAVLVVSVAGPGAGMLAQRIAAQRPEPGKREPAGRPAKPAPDAAKPAAEDGNACVVPRERVVKWDPGLNPAGGVPSASWQIHTTVLPSGGDDTTAINDALTAAGAVASAANPRVVKLSAGTFIVSGTIRIPASYVVLRGTPSTMPEIGGGNGTKILPRATANGYTAIAASSANPSNYCQSANLAADGVKDSSTITLASWPFRPALSAGELVLVDQLTDTSYNRWNPARSPGGAHDASRGWSSRFDRPTGQVVEIASLDSSAKAVTFTTPLHIAYKTANAAQLSRFADNPDANFKPTLKYVGVEDLYVFGACRPDGPGAGQGNVWLDGVSYSWVKNVETDYNNGPAIKLDASFRCVIRDCFVHSTEWPYPGGAGYGIVLGWHAADNLIENNISVTQNKVLVMRATGGGNVVAYNYLDDGYIGNNMDWQEVGANASHMTTPMYELFEGNQAFNFDADNTWGNSIYLTIFRNHFPGVRRSGDPATRWNYQYNTYATGAGRRQGAVPMSNVSCRAAGLMEGHWWYSFIGNVLGGPGVTALTKYEICTPPWSGSPVWKLGYNPERWDAQADPKVLSTVIRDGNYDYVTKQVHWAGGPKALPKSLYLTSKPAFFGSSPWPWVDPIGSLHLHTLPARARFDGMCAKLK